MSLKFIMIFIIIIDPAPSHFDFSIHTLRVPFSAPMTVFVFFAAAAVTWIVAADFWLASDYCNSFGAAGFSHLR